MRILILVLIILAVILSFFFLKGGEKINIPKGETVSLEESPENTEVGKSSREIFLTDEIKHSIPLDEIRQGCFGRDCIPSVDDPEFVDSKATRVILSDSAIGIGLNYSGEQRFYPFDMLVTREIVNDTIGGNPVLVTYCPLCGTGIVFNRTVDGQTQEFGVSGMLWQSNLLMYNRADAEENVSLWSQVLGEAVLGVNTGDKLDIIPSDIVRLEDWVEKHPKTVVLDTGRIGDPYNGNYYEVASGFQPNFDEDSSLLDPSEYVFGINIDDQYKAYARKDIPEGKTTDMFADKSIAIEKDKTGVVRFFADGSSEPLAVVTGFWFSWVSAHPETELFK